MSVGNLKTYGGKGTNMPWQLKMLVGLEQILAASGGGGGGSNADFEAILVLDADNDTWLEVRIYDPATGTFNPPVYYLAGTNTPGTPVAPITYINPNSYLAQIVSNTSSSSRTPNMLRTSTSGTVTVAVYSFSVANVGLGNGTILGQTIKPGETINFDAGSSNNYYTGFAYNGTGTELLITYNA